jgi:hypothetical protein
MGRRGGDGHGPRAEWSGCAAIYGGEEASGAAPEPRGPPELDYSNKIIFSGFLTHIYSYINNKYI